MAKTCSSSTPHAVAAGPDASFPPSDSGSDQVPDTKTRWTRPASSSTVKRSIRSLPHDTAAVAEITAWRSMPRRLLGGEPPAEIVGGDSIESAHRAGAAAAQLGEHLGNRPPDEGDAAQGAGREL